ncbi:MAG: hypothetical protein J4F48_07890 [Nitrospinae bacterium]|nr:hypothetical protein [Nitrospinota bacterium]
MAVHFPLHTAQIMQFPPISRPWAKIVLLRSVLLRGNIQGFTAVMKDCFSRSSAVEKSGEIVLFSHQLMMESFSL